jgi:hypothetical protein
MPIYLDAADVIAELDTGTYTVTRRAAATTDGHGRKLPPLRTQLAIDASIQPANGRDLQRLPELRRASETRVIYTTTPLLVGGQGSANESDLLAIQAEVWFDRPGLAGIVTVEVQHVESWPGYCRAICQVALDAS